MKAQSDSICKYSENIDLYYSSALSYFDKKVDLSSDCVYSLLDTLTQRYLNTNDQKYLYLMDKIAFISDGIVSEYFDDIVTTIALKTPNNFINFLCTKYGSDFQKGLGYFFLNILVNSKANTVFYQKVKGAINDEMCNCNFEQLKVITTSMNH